MRTLQDSSQGIQPEHVKALVQNRWFNYLSEKLRADMLQHVSARTLRQGEYLYRRGDHTSATGCGFCVSILGRLKTSGQSPTGKEFILSVLEPGNWFGEIALVLNRPHTHDVSALEPCTVLCVEHSHLEQLLLTPEFRDALLRLTTVRLHQAFVQWEDLCTLDSSVLVARRLCVEARGGPDESHTPNSILQVSREILASMLGMTRQTLQKELRLLVEEKIITCHYKSIEILDFNKLTERGQLPPDNKGRHGRAT